MPKVALKALLLSLALLQTPFSAPAVAQSDVFTVTGVEIDARGRTATDARTTGLQRGQIEALNQLYGRLVPRSYQDQIPALSSREAIDLVRNFSVANERSASGRYLADLTVQFRPDAIRTALRFVNVPFAETVSKPVVVVPVYQESIVSPAVLWADPNPWRDAWGRLAPSKGLVPRQLPYGDLADLTSLQTDDAMARDQGRLAAFAARYEADEAIVVSGSLIGTLGAESLRVSLYSTRTGKEQSIVIPAQGGQTWADLFVAAAAEAWAVIEDEWKQENMLQFGVTGQITALVPLSSLEDWLTVRNRLEKVPLVDRFELQAMTRDRAQVTVFYIGSEDQLKLAMAQSDLGFVWQDQAWVIEDRRASSDVIQTFGGATTEPSQMPVPSQTQSTRQLPNFQNSSAYPSGLFGGQSAPQSSPAQP